MMNQVFKLAGVVQSEKSPFCHDFTSTKELLAAYVSYCPRTFSYKSKSGKAGDEDDEDVSCSPNDDDDTDNNRIYERLRYLSEDIVAESTKKEPSTKKNERKVGDEDKQGNDDDDNECFSAEEEPVKSTIDNKANANTMNKFTQFLNSTTVANLVDNVLSVSEALEGLGGREKSNHCFQGG